MGEDNKKPNKNFQVVSIVAILAIGILLLWFLYFLPMSFNSADNKLDTNNIFSSQNLKLLGGQFRQMFDSAKNSIGQQASSLNNLNLNINVNLPQLTNEQVEDLKNRVESFVNNNPNLNNINQ